MDRKDPVSSHEGAVERALAWLELRHRKSIAEALREFFDETLAEVLDTDDDELIDEAKAGLDVSVLEHIQINLIEWMLAEGDMRIRGEYRRVSEVLLSAPDLVLSAGQRDWLQQMAHTSLRLYDVTQVIPDQSVTVCDVLDAEQLPLVVHERMGSRGMRVGMTLGARVLKVDGKHVFSGALHVFAPLTKSAVIDLLRRQVQNPIGGYAEDLAFEQGLTIFEQWLAQFVLPEPVPNLVHQATGEPLMFVKDHYDVHDWLALSGALALQPDVTGQRENGWERTREYEDGAIRPLALIAAGADGKSATVSYSTVGLAERGREWFDALVGAAATFRTRDVVDPRELLVKRGGVSNDGPGLAAAGGLSPSTGLQPDLLADAIADVIRRSYANWADEPIPALDGKSPRQAIRTAAGLERVKGLLRSYEDGEAQQAKRQGRREISYQFLWDQLGLEHEPAGHSNSP